MEQSAPGRQLETLPLQASSGFRPVWSRVAESVNVVLTAIAAAGACLTGMTWVRKSVAAPDADPNNEPGCQRTKTRSDIYSRA